MAACTDGGEGGEMGANPNHGANPAGMGKSGASSTVKAASLVPPVPSLASSVHAPVASVDWLTTPWLTPLTRYSIVELSRSSAMPMTLPRVTRGGDVNAALGCSTPYAELPSELWLAP